MRPDHKIGTVVSLPRAISPGCRRIRAARRASGLTQEQAAQAVGVDVKTFRRWEHGGGVRAIDALCLLEGLASEKRRAA